ncbi:hypothetical protein ACVWY3_003685 [Bradyrhizobium sp. USDA 4486]
MEPELIGPPVPGQTFRRKVFHYYVTYTDRDGQPPRAEREKCTYVG